MYGRVRNVGWDRAVKMGGVQVSKPGQVYHVQVRGQVLTGTLAEISKVLRVSERTLYVRMWQTETIGGKPRQQALEETVGFYLEKMGL